MNDSGTRRGGKCVPPAERLLACLRGRGELQPLTSTLKDIASLTREALDAVAVDIWIPAAGGLKAFEPGVLLQQAEAIAGPDGWFEVRGHAWTVGQAYEEGIHVWSPAGEAGADGSAPLARALAVPLAAVGRNGGTLEMVGVAACQLARHEPDGPEMLGPSGLWRSVAGALAIALSVEAMRGEAEDATDRMRALREQETLRARVSFAQQKLLDAAIGKSSSRAAHLTEVVSSALNRSILVVDGEGHEVASACNNAAREVLRTAVEAVLKGETAPADVSGRLLSVDAQTGRAAGAILATPAIAAREVDAARLIACLADLLSTKLGMLKHEGRMVDVVHPLALLGLCSRDSNHLRRRDLADLLMISERTPLRIASIRTPTPEAAFRCATIIGRGSGEELGVIASAALNNDVIVLLRDDDDRLEDRFGRLRSLLAVEVLIGVSSRLNGIDAIVSGYKESQIAIGRGGDKASVSFFADAPRLRDIMEELAGGQGDRGLRSVFGPILDLERGDQADIIAVLQAFMEHNGDLDLLSAALDRHRDVVAGVLTRAASLTRLDFSRYQDVATLAAALEYLDVRDQKNRQGN